MSATPEADAAFREYVRLVIIQNDEDWADDHEGLARELGRPLDGPGAIDSFASAHAAYDKGVCCTIR